MLAPVGYLVSRTGGGQLVARKSYRSAWVYVFAVLLFPIGLLLLLGNRRQLQADVIIQQVPEGARVLVSGTIDRIGADRLELLAAEAREKYPALHPAAA